MGDDLDRFKKAQNNCYHQILEEMRNGKSELSQLKNIENHTNTYLEKSFNFQKKEKMT